MKKIAIITMYNNSINYGGILQAYALQRYIESNLHFETRQIDYQRKNTSNSLSLKKRLKEKGLTFTINWATDRILKKVNSNISKILISKDIRKQFLDRCDKFKTFREMIPHTAPVSNENIEKLNNEFDIFICGSDQIWKPGVCCNAYTLKFVNKNKKKISYAASISKSDISESDLNKLYDDIKDYNAISIRENSDVELINSKYNMDTQWVVDPTLLLEKEEWDSVASSKIIKEKYIFCYLLEANRKRYKIIKSFAKKNDLVIVTIPFANGSLNLKDQYFGDYKIYNAGPRDFISLIKNAEIIITDSFHATVFSNIFSKKYYVLERKEEVTMNTRIKSLLSLFNQDDRFISDDDVLLKTNQLMDYKNKKCEFLNLKIKSQKYLEKNVL